MLNKQGGRGSQILLKLCGRHKWMPPKQKTYLLWNVGICPTAKIQWKTALLFSLKLANQLQSYGRKMNTTVTWLLAIMEQFIMQTNNWVQHLRPRSTPQCRDLDLWPKIVLLVAAWRLVIGGCVCEQDNLVTLTQPSTKHGKHGPGLTL